jgi:hypothetical protein
MIPIAGVVWLLVDKTVNRADVTLLWTPPDRAVMLHVDVARQRITVISRGLGTNTIPELILSLRYSSTISHQLQTYSLYSCIDLYTISTGMLFSGTMIHVVNQGKKIVSLLSFAAVLH